MKENEKRLRSTVADDYSQVLPIFIYPSEQQSQSMYPDMDKVIEKCSQVIERHTMYIKKKEHVKWIDDSYYLVGKARFYKEEYGLAEETFLYVYQAFKKNPNRYKGLNGMIRTYIETDQWDKAEDFLDIGEEELKNFEQEDRAIYNALYADYHLKKDQDIDKAIEKLEDAIALTKDKKIRRRYVFVLAQLYQEQRNYPKATELYGQVLKLNPDYVMRFNARINRAIAYDIGANNSDAIKKELKKMLRDKKNVEFQDQIYYALAELVLKEGDEPLALEYLRKSVRASVNNNKQKALSYYKLADLYFERPDYVRAQAHYDSTLQFLPQDHPDYYEAESKNNDLQELVKNLKQVMLQDSLLALGSLSEKDRKKKVDKMIKAMKDEEERRELAKLRALEQRQQNDNNYNPLGNTRNRGQWYFYNVTTMALGRTEFQQIWGERQLADNWNRKNKTSIAVVEQREEEEVDPEQLAEDSLKEAEKYNPEFYLKDIPTDLKSQLAAHGKLVIALFNVGTIFKESFMDYPSAIKAFKRITAEYDTSSYNLPAHYQLYRVYTTIAETELAEQEKKWILENHPFSEYAYLIKNPNYSKESKETKQKVEEFYQATYKLYEYEMYEDVIASCNRAETAFTRNHLRPQFAFMKAKSIGYARDKESLRKALEYVVTEFPEDPVKEKAQEILDKMNAAKAEEPKSGNKPFTRNAEEKHMFVFSIPGKNADRNAFKNKVSNFNNQFFREGGLSITASSLGENQLFLVRFFNSEFEAMRYYKAIRNNSQLMLNARQIGAEEYIISVPNFRLLFQQKNEAEYKDYFKQEIESN